ncbi:MAG: DUF1272 domain-containing protein [bacterium]
MRKTCEKCEASLTDQAEAYICSYECTFCADCNETLSTVCRTAAADSYAGPNGS